MPKREQAPLGAPCWVDVTTSDADRAQAFYGQLFGWTASESAPEFGGDVHFSQDGVLVSRGAPAPPRTRAADAWGGFPGPGGARKDPAQATQGRGPRRP